MSLSISNAHARATVLSAVWSPVDHQLVAVLMAATDKAALVALKAELEKNNKNSYVALAGDAQAELTGARRGYVHLSVSLEKANAQGHVSALLHWKAHDPRAVVTKTTQRKADDTTPADEYFYVVARQEDDLPKLFLERLQLALPWPLQPAWAKALLDLAHDYELVDSLPVATSRELAPHHAFKAALRVLNSEELWGELITISLRSGLLTF
jgi:hypothetical protein